MVSDAIRFFANHFSMMVYVFHESQNWPVGPGVNEVACKNLIKQQLAGWYALENTWDQNPTDSKFSDAYKRQMATVLEQGNG